MCPAFITFPSGVSNHAPHPNPTSPFLIVRGGTDAGENGGDRSCRRSDNPRRLLRRRHTPADVRPGGATSTCPGVDQGRRFTHRRCSLNRPLCGHSEAGMPRLSGHHSSLDAGHVRWLAQGASLPHGRTARRHSAPHSRR